MSLTAGFGLLLSQNSKEMISEKFVSASFEIFYVNKPFPMKISSYIDHFLYQVDIEENILVSAFLIIEPFLPFISNNNIHKIVVTALTIAYKAFTDRPVKNSTIEKIGILKPGELKRLEIAFLDYISWNLNYSNLEESYKKLIEFSKKEKEEKTEDLENSEEFETNFTEQDSTDSFSELGYFF